MKTSLRKWQADAKDLLIAAFLASVRHVGVLEACTGAGKTTLGSATCGDMMASGEVDLTVVLSPTVETKRGWLRNFNRNGKFNVVDDGESYAPDSNVWLSTYAGWKSIKSELVARVKAGAKVFLIIDEYHHAEHAAEWGKPVNEFGLLSRHVLFLSGTPWRRDGKIALLNDAETWKGGKYYEEAETGRVTSDIQWTYREDLASPDSDRATVPAYFDFLPSVAKDDKGRVVDVLHEFAPTHRETVSGEKVALTESEIEEWYEEARKYDRPLGKHLGTVDPTLTDNDLARRVLQKAASRLEQSRREIRQKTGVADASVMLVVCKSVSDARLIAAYIQEAMELSAEVVVSEDAKSAKTLAEIAEKCQSNSPGKPDVIVSVGMISEGVDIPQIKVIAYLSAIITLLYLVQVIGRALRRMLNPNKPGQYLDVEDINDTPAYIVAPGHPKIMYVAKTLEKQIQEALGTRELTKKTEPGVEKPRPEPQKYTVESEGPIQTMFRGSEGVARTVEIADRMLSQERAGECGLTDRWKAYVMELCQRGNDVKVAQLLEEACSCLGMKLEDFMEDAHEYAAHNMPYSIQNRLLRKDAQRLATRIRFSVSPYKEMEDDRLAFGRVRGRINSMANIEGGIEKATVEQKRAWIEAAHNVLRNAGEVDE